MKPDQVSAHMNDFIEYWSAARLTLDGKNPYSPELMFEIQKPAGWLEDRPLMMWNPPWALTLVLPFGLLNYPIGQVFWLIFNLAALLISIDICWRLYSGGEGAFLLVWMLAFMFFPFLFVLRSGQITPLIMLGVTGFVFLLNKDREKLAGSVVVLASLKPHLLFLFWVAVVFWAVDRKRWRIIIGLVGTFLFCSAVPLVFNPLILSQFLESVAKDSPLYWMTPTLGALLRRLFGVEKSWMQFIPSLLGLLWFIVYWIQNRTSWNWQNHLPTVLLSSVVLSSYGWSFDLVVLLPVIIFTAMRLRECQQKFRITAGLVLYVLLNGILFFMNNQGANEFAFVWVSPVILVCIATLLRGLSPGIQQS
ncbi:MAG TPA: glycosyltransferase family 87 protein [Candidatus Hodarchaeales archaeon]|nr:glycosyltransferase family 87 protein [Candidatus Hodarchaeales archaeon]